MRPWLQYAIPTVLLLALSLPGRAQAPGQAACNDCHEDEVQDLKNSAHASITCRGCHAGVNAFPHSKLVAKVDCSLCHADVVHKFKRSVHAAASKSDGPRCQSCHGAIHKILPQSNPASPVYPLNLPRTCAACHGSPKLTNRYGFPNVYQLYLDSIHGFALTKDGLLVAAQCSNCHGSHEILSKNDPRSRIFHNNVPSTCGSCHAGVEARYLSGMHGKALAGGGKARVPVCSDCHTAHQISGVQAVAWQTMTVVACGRCHSERLKTYHDTFHGQVTTLGFVATARCWSCHRAHLILPASDPKSTIAPQNLQITCGKCHASVTKSFVTYQPHANPRNKNLNPTLYYVTRFMNLLLLTVLVFFGLHAVLWFFRSLFDRPEPKGPLIGPGGIQSRRSV